MLACVRDATRDEGTVLILTGANKMKGSHKGYGGRVFIPAITEGRAKDR